MILQRSPKKNSYVQKTKSPKFIHATNKMRWASEWWLSYPQPIATGRRLPFCLFTHAIFFSPWILCENQNLQDRRKKKLVLVRFLLNSELLCIMEDPNYQETQLVG